MHFFSKTVFGVRVFVQLNSARAKAFKNCVSDTLNEAYSGLCLHAMPRITHSQSIRRKDNTTVRSLTSRSMSSSRSLRVYYQSVRFVRKVVSFVQVVCKSNSNVSRINVFVFFFESISNWANVRSQKGRTTGPLIKKLIRVV